MKWLRQILQAWLPSDKWTIRKPQFCANSFTVKTITPRSSILFNLLRRPAWTSPLIAEGAAIDEAVSTKAKEQNITLLATEYSSDVHRHRYQSASHLSDARTDRWHVHVAELASLKSLHKLQEMHPYLKDCTILTNSKRLQFLLIDFSKHFLRYVPFLHHRIFQILYLIDFFCFFTTAFQCAGQ